MTFTNLTYFSQQRRENYCSLRRNGFFMSLSDTLERATQVSVLPQLIQKILGGLPQHKLLQGVQLFVQVYAFYHKSNRISSGKFSITRTRGSISKYGSLYGDRSLQIWNNFIFRRDLPKENRPQLLYCPTYAFIFLISSM